MTEFILFVIVLVIVLIWAHMNVGALEARCKAEQARADEHERFLKALYADMKGTPMWGYSPVPDTIWRHLIRNAK